MTQVRKILLAGGAGLRQTLAAEFSATPEFAIIQVDSLEGLAREAERASADLILVDGDLVRDPDCVADELRNHGFSGPLLMLCSGSATGGPARYERLSRPFRFAELQARIQRLLACEDSGFDEIFAIGPFRFSPRSKSLIRDGSNALRLTDTETAILVRLAQARGASISRTALLREVWGYSPTVATRTLETHIHRLRRKMERNPAKPSLLVTERSGYRLARDGSTGAASGNERYPLREQHEHGSRR